MQIEIICGYFDLNLYYYCRDICGHGMLRLTIQSLMLWGNWWFVLISGSETGRKMEKIECLGRYECTDSDSRRCRRWSLSFLVKKSICDPLGGMEGVCRVVIAMHYQMSHESSLSTKCMPLL